MLVLTNDDLTEVLGLDACISAVERAFTLAHHGHVLRGTRVHVPAPTGAFHLVVGGLAEEPCVLVVKSNLRREAHVRGFVMLQEADTGAPVALLDSRRITLMRTAALVTILTRRLAQKRASQALIVGAGPLAALLVPALRTATPSGSIAMWSRDANKTRRAAAAFGSGVTITTGDLAPAVAKADVIVTATSADRPLFPGDAVAKGALVIGLGADAPGKQELDPELLGRARVVVDDLQQCVLGGEVGNALGAGTMTPADVVGDVAAVVAGELAPRQDQGDIVVVDSTGTAIQDVAAAMAAVDTARALGRGTELPLG